ncbi:MAG TPA: VWA domain-containing protein [Blastocatellia bacterium]|jgi:VWFA-related protein|nr:VWA domain-containing protein [Blastocatellia bacterium]
MNKHFKISSIIALSGILLLLAGAVGGATPQSDKKSEGEDAVKLNATLVQVPIVAADKSGRFVVDLSKDDFTLIDDGKRQEISLFSAVKQSFNAVLILDTSNSAEDRLGAMQQTALTFASQLSPGDKMMVISFDNEVRQLTDFTSSRKEIEAAIKGTESGFGKLLYEAVMRGLDQLKEAEGRRALILFSDGVDMKSIDASAEDTYRKAEEIGAAIYVVRFDTRWWIEADVRRQEAENKQANLPFSIDGRIPLPPDFGGPDPNPKKTGPRIEIGAPKSPPITVIDGISGRTVSTKNAAPDKVSQQLNRVYGEANTYLETLAARTGGAVFAAETFGNTEAAFAMIADELRNQYMIGFYPRSDRRDGKYRKIKVEVNRKDIRLRARQGYRLPPQD